MKWTAVVAMLVTGAIHILDARSAFGEATYKGVLFIVNGVGAFIAAVAIIRERTWGWWLGLLIAGGALVGYVLSRSIGLPGLPGEPDAWFEPIGVASMVAEVLFLAAFAIKGRGNRRWE